MKNYYIVACILLVKMANINAQTYVDTPPTAFEYFEVAKNHIKQANYDNAIAALTKASELSPQNILYKQELGRVYLLNSQPKLADKLFTKLLKEKLADENTYKYAAESKIALDEFDAAKKIVNDGLDKFNTSAILYFTKGNLFDYYKEFSQALAAYEKGIELDQLFPLNYYKAAQMQLKNPNNFIAGLLYAESYIALDPFSYRTDEMKAVLYDSYNKICKLLRNDEDIVAHSNILFYSKNRAFEKRFIEVLELCKPAIEKTNTATNLNTFRTKFIVEWFRKQPVEMMPNILLRQQLYLSEGIYATYNQWLFGAFSNIKEYELWTKSNEGYLKDMYLFFKENPYIPENQSTKEN
jgi:tetratricopeptide (TPR) repeat protein